MAAFNPWQQALYGLSSGLMAAGQPGGFQNFGQGVGQGVGQFQDQQSRLVREQMLQKQFEREESDYETKRLEKEAEQKRRAALTGNVSGLLQTYDDQDTSNDAFGALSPAQLSLARVQLESNPEGLLTQIGDWTKGSEPKGAGSSIGKLAEDLKAGLIDQSTYDALVKKETYIAPREGPGLTERQRNAQSAGLQPGTPEYAQYILGRDDTAAGPFQGTGLDAQAYNIVLTGDPASPEYAAAYSQLAQPKVSMDPNTGQLVSTQPDIAWARKPAAAAGAPVDPSVTTTNVPGATITSRAPDIMASTPEQRNSFKKQTLAIDNLESALTEYEGALDKYGSMETYGAGKGVLETAYANILIQAKEAAALGALTGPDMQIMEQTIIPPNSVSQTTVGGASGVKAQMGSVRSQLKQKRDNLNRLYGPQGTTAPQSDIPPPPPGFEPLQ